jgi:DNA-binding transcriptional MerR regulator
MNDSTNQTLLPPMPTPVDPPDASGISEPAPRLLRIQEVAAEIGVTTRTIRYYEEIGLLRPAARSVGDYRLYDESDVQRIRYIRELRDVAGFSLAEVEQMLEDEEARARNRVIYRSTEDVAVRRRIVTENLERANRTVVTLRAKQDRLAGMIEAAEARRTRLTDVLSILARPNEDVR